MEGARAIKEKRIIAGLATHDPRGIVVKEYAEYDEVSVARDRDRIESLYQHEGYFSARVTKVEVRKVSARAVEVVFSVEEGEPTRVEAIDLETMPPRPPAAKKDAPLDELILASPARPMSGRTPTRASSNGTLGAGFASICSSGTGARAAPTCSGSVAGHARVPLAAESAKALRAR